MALTRTNQLAHITGSVWPDDSTFNDVIPYDHNSTGSSQLMLCYINSNWPVDVTTLTYGGVAPDDIILNRSDIDARSIAYILVWNSAPNGLNNLNIEYSPHDNTATSVHIQSFTDGVIGRVVLNPEIEAVNSINYFPVSNGSLIYAMGFHDFSTVGGMKYLRIAGSEWNPWPSDPAGTSPTRNHIDYFSQTGPFAHLNTNILSVSFNNVSVDATMNRVDLYAIEIRDVNIDPVYPIRDINIGKLFINIT